MRDCRSQQGIDSKEPVAEAVGLDAVDIEWT